MKRALLLLPFVAGCAMLERPAESARAPIVEAAPVVSRSAASDLMGFLARIRPMTESQLTAEAARQRRAGDDVARVKAALALSLAHGDDAEIVALVEPVVRREAADATVRAMAGFLQVMAADRRRLRESAAAANAKLRDERRAQENLKQRAEAAQERAAQLQEKIDALTEIEKSLSDRQVQNR